MTNKKNSDILLPNEPTRFTGKNFLPLLSFCSEHNASDITLQTNEQVMAEIEGKLLKITKHRLSNTEVGDILNNIYGPNGTTQLLSGTDVDTHYEFKPNRFTRFRYRVNGTSCQVEGQHGIQLTLRIIPTTPPKLDELDLPESITNNITPNDGIIYVTGATGSGKSTLLASIIRELAEQPDSNRKILTYESPIEFVFDAIDKPSAIVSQTEIPRNLPSYEAGIRNALRRKPMAILVGEARDSETISAAIEAALTGHPVYTTLHSNGVAETIRRLVGSFPIEEKHGKTMDIIETVRLIIWQKLVPGVDGKRVALREHLVFDEQVRDQLLNTPINEVTAETRRLLKQKGMPMVVDAKKQFKAGRISKRTFDLLCAESERIDNDLSQK